MSSILIKHPFDFVTQLVEYHTFNVRVVGSNPTGITTILGCIPSVLYAVERVTGYIWVQSPSSQPKSILLKIFLYLYMLTLKTNLL